jgi:hypothetical protein
MRPLAIVGAALLREVGKVAAGAAPLLEHHRNRQPGGVQRGKFRSAQALCRQRRTVAVIVIPDDGLDAGQCQPVSKWRDITWHIDYFKHGTSSYQ